MNTPNHPTFDQSEHDILSNLVEDDEPVTVLDDQPGAPEAPTAPDAPVETLEAAATAEAPATPEPAPPQGDPRAALRASRRAEKRMRDELDQLRGENEALKQGKAPVDTSVSDAELAELDADFPLQAKIVRRQREIEAQLKQVQPQPQAEFEAPSYDSDIQDVIDGVPDLVAWQYDPAQQDKFARAVQYDVALSADPDWQGRDITERFTEAVRRTKAALSPSFAAPAVAPRNNPADVIAAVPVQGPKGISDFRGGAPANTQTVNYQGMSDEQIMASLPMT